MSLSTMSRRERTACAVLGMAVLYGLLLPLAYIGLEGWLLVLPLLVVAAVMECYVTPQVMQLFM